MRRVREKSDSNVGGKRSLLLFLRLPRTEDRSNCNSSMTLHFNLPNFLTLSRILVVPPIFWLWSCGAPLWAAGLATLGAFTDFFDGRLARRWKQETALGALLDPVCDKVMVVSLLGLLASEAMVPGWLACLSLLRNTSQLTAIPVLMWWKKIPFHVRPAFLPKFASGLSFAIIVVAFLAAGIGQAGELLQPLLFLSSVLLTVLEVQILVTFWPRFGLILRRKHDTFE